MTIYKSTRGYKKMTAKNNYNYRKLRHNYWKSGKEQIGKFVKDGNYYLKDRCNGVVMYKKNHYNALKHYKGPTTRAMTNFFITKHFLRREYNIHI